MAHAARWTHVAVFATTLLSARSFAQEPGPVQQGVARFNSGDLEGALAEFAEADGATDLTKQDLLVLLQYRAAIHHALGDTFARDQSLTQLAALEPGTALLDVVSPAVRETFSSLHAVRAGPLRLVVRKARTARGAEIEAQIENDVGLVREVVVETSINGGPWERRSASSARIASSANDRVEYRVEVRGPGGSRLAYEEGEFPSAVATRISARAADPATRVSEAGVTERNASSRRSYLWIGIAAATAAVLAGSLSAYFYLSRDETNQVAPPMADW